VVPHAQLLPVVQGMAESIAGHDPYVVRELRALYRRSQDLGLPEALEHEYAEREARRAARGQLVPNAAVGAGPARPAVGG
jgi:enoyl-CoA hydratase/carnithine racemase